jgi:nucleotide-binding universal stress UspA family protein
VKILVCIDGEPHSKSAVRRAIFLSLSLSAELSALYVIDPWLKKFYNELYSQGRKRYLEYVDECLRAQAEQVQKEFKEMCLAQGLQARFKTRHGEPMAEILEEVRQLVPDLLITGSKQLNVWGKFRSGNLPFRLRKKIGSQLSMISIKGTEQLFA